MWKEEGGGLICERGRGGVINDTIVPGEKLLSDTTVPGKSY